jgi:hypothetical protein
VAKLFFSLSSLSSLLALSSARKGAYPSRVTPAIPYSREIMLELDDIVCMVSTFLIVSCFFRSYSEIILTRQQKLLGVTWVGRDRDSDSESTINYLRKAYDLSK